MMTGPGARWSLLILLGAVACADDDSSVSDASSGMVDMDGADFDDDGLVGLVDVLFAIGPSHSRVRAANVAVSWFD